MTASTTIQAIPQAVLDAALALHQRKNTDLTYSPFSTAEVTTVEGNPFWRCVEDEIEFANLEARNRCAALATFQQVMPLSGIDALFDAAYELWRNEIGHPDSASGRLLGLASQNVSVLLEAAKVIGDKSRRVFDVLHLLEKALPHLPNTTCWMNTSSMTRTGAICAVHWPWLAMSNTTKETYTGSCCEPSGWFRTTQRRVRSCGTQTSKYTNTCTFMQPIFYQGLRRLLSGCLKTWRSGLHTCVSLWNRSKEKNAFRQWAAKLVCQRLT